MAVVAGTVILFLAAVASTIVLLPFAAVVSLLCLAGYGVIDSAIVLTTGFMIPRAQPGRVAVRVQGIFGASIGIALFALFFKRVDLPWFLYLAAMQAAGASITEFIVARGTSAHHGARWCYVSAVIAALSAITLLSVAPLSGRDLSPHLIAWVISGYLGIFGLNLLALAARMLFAERDLLLGPRRESHPG